MDRTLSKEFPHPQPVKTGSEMASAQGRPINREMNWPGVLVVTTFVVLLAGLYHEILLKLGIQWNNDPDYSHGFLVPVLVGYFVWERWDRLKAIPITPSLWGAALLAVGLLMLVIGSIGAELYLQRSSLILVIAGLVWLTMGRDALKTLMFPIAFMFFMVPLPAIVVNAVSFPLQLFAARTAEFCLFNFGIPVLREGNVIVLAGTTLEVAEACSGIRSLQALLALGTVYAYFSQRSTWKRWVLVLLSVPIAIAANAFRVSGTGVLANYWGSQAAEGFYHTFSGWLIFVVAFLLLLGCGGLLSKIGNNRKAAA
ncbi:MAG TPA: exosortase A [Nitrospiraceae bacterium]|nr:exosortase A [Nitrospiraceae bacterium]